MTEVGRARAARFTPSLVRLLRPDGSAVGLGLLVGRDQVVTCAHVVNQALDREITAPEIPARPVQLDFPFTAPGHRFTAATVAWTPLGDDGSGDIAGLRIHGDPPDGAIPSPMAAADDLFGHPFQVFGFLAGHDTGVWVTGELRGSDTVGSIHLVGEAESGLRISPGFSGSPVWDAKLDAVVGITSRAAIGPRTPPSAYCVSTASVIDAWPEIEPAMRPPCPFRGLQPFREVDEDNFFGRHELTELLVGDLPHRRLTILTGPSGCGKSSMINAGVIPGLRRRSDLSVTVCRPGVAPYAALVEAIAPRPAAEGPASVITELPSGETFVREIADRLDAGERERLVIFIDQMEELFAHPPDVVEAVTELLLHLVTARRPDGRPLVCVVIATRGDHLDRLVELAPITDALAIDRDDPQSGIRHVLQMTDRELREAIEQPVRRAKVVRLEDGLIERLLRDVRRLSNPLALLAFAMTELWDRQRLGIVALSAYEEIGGVAGALRRHLDQVLDEELSPEDRVRARRILVRLAIPRTPEGYVGRQLRREEIDPEYWPLIQRLAGRRVVALDVAADGAETVELAHEALLDEWPTLREWLDGDREFLTWYSELRMAMAVWGENRKSSEGLLQGTRLADALRWVAERRGELADGEVRFVERSRTALLLRRRVRAIVAFSLVLVLLIGAGFAVLWVNSRKNEQVTSDSAAAQTNASTAIRDPDPIGALPAALARYRRNTPLQALRAMQQWYAKTEDVQWIRPVHFDTVQGAVFSPDGVHVVAGGERTGGLVLTRLDDPALKTVPVTADYEGGKTFSPDGRYVIYGDSGRRIVFWDIARRSVVRRVPTYGPKDSVVRSLALSDSGDRLAYSRGDAVQVVDSRSGERLGPGLPTPVERNSRLSGQLWFDGSGRELYTLGTESSVFTLASGRRRSLADERIVARRADGSAYVTCRSPSGQGRGVTAVVDAETGKTIGPSLKLDESCIDDTFGLDSRNLYVFPHSGPTAPVTPQPTTLEVRDIASGTVTGRLQVPKALGVTAINQGPAGSRLLIQSIDSVYQLRVPPQGSLDRSLGVADDAVLTPDGARAATVSAAGLQVWDVPGRRLVNSVAAKTLCAGEALKGERLGVVTSGDGSALAVTCRHRITAVDARSGRPTGTLLAEEPPKNQRGSVPDPPLVYFTTAHELLVDFGRLTLLDTSTGRRKDDVLGDFHATYASVTPRFGSPDVAALRQDMSAVDIVDLSDGHRVQSLPIRVKAGDGVELAFDRTGGLLGVTTTNPPSMAVWSVSQRKRMAFLPGGTSLKPLGFTRDGDQFVLDSLDGLSSDSRLIYWRWRGGPGLLHEDEFAQVPYLGSRASLAIETKRIIYSQETGWGLLDLDPDEWRRRLCGLATEARITLTPPKTASSAPPCPPR